MSNLANRFIDVVFNLSNHRYDAAITLLSTLIDRTAKDTYQIKEVGVRFRKLIDDNADFILWYSTEGALQFSSVIIGDKTIGTVFYKIIRNAEIHEAELRDIEFVTRACP